MNSSEDAGKVTVITDFMERSENTLARMASAVTQTEKLAATATQAFGVKQLGITSLANARARALMGDNPCARPAQIMPSEDNGGYKEFIETIGAYCPVDDEPQP